MGRMIIIMNSKYEFKFGMQIECLEMLGGNWFGQFSISYTMFKHLVFLSFNFLFFSGISLSSSMVYRSTTHKFKKNQSVKICKLRKLRQCTLIALQMNDVWWWRWWLALIFVIVLFHFFPLSFSLLFDLRLKLIRMQIDTHYVK